MNHAGLHWPANAGGEHPNVETILSMPGIRQGCTLICADSARYWYRQARGASPLVVWRAIPRQGRLPADLDWIVKRVADECLNLWDEQPHSGIEWFLPLNELQFEREAGESFPGYRTVAEHLDGLRRELRKRLPGVNLMFPSWVPTDDLERSSEWVPRAQAWDGICLHAYGSAQEMHDRYWAYRALFGASMPIFVGEWNANHTGADERESLLMWANIAEADPQFLGAAYYIWETHNDGERDLSIWGNPDRLALFRDPPIGSIFPPSDEEPKPEPVPPPEPIPVQQLTDEPDHLFSFEELWPTIKAAGDEFGFDPQVLAGIILQESGWRNWRVHRDGTGHGLLGLDDGGLLPDFENWSGLSIGRGQSAASIPIVPQIRYAAHALADYARRLGGSYAAARAWHRGEGAMDDARGQQYEGLIRAHVADLFSGGEAPTVPRVTYNRDEPPIAQNDPWSCAPTSTRWALTAVGRHPQEAWMEAQMQADGIVTQADGLLDASGGALAAWITQQYGEFGYSANNESRGVSFDALAAEFMAPANPYPGLLGGTAWGHWSGLRSYDSQQDVLLLANPSEGYKGVGQTMNRQQFSSLGPFSLVRVLHPDLTGESPPPPPPPPVPTPPATDPKDAVIAQLQVEVASLKHDLDGAYSKLGVASTDYVKGLRDLANAYEALKPPV